MEIVWDHLLDSQAEGTKLKSRLTAREVEILRHLAEGKTNKEISKLLILSTSTIKNHISSIFTKLNVRNRSQATSYAIRSGLADGFIEAQIVP